MFFLQHRFLHRYDLHDSSTKVVSVQVKLNNWTLNQNVRLFLEVLSAFLTWGNGSYERFKNHYCIWAVSSTKCSLAFRSKLSVGLDLQYLAVADCYFSLSLETCTIQTWILLGILKSVSYSRNAFWNSFSLPLAQLSILQGGWWNCILAPFNQRCSPARIPSGGFRVNSTDTKRFQVIFCNRKDE